MELKSESRDGVLVVALTEAREIDFTVSDGFKQALAAALEASPQHVVLDASLIGFFDSAGMSALLSAKKLLARREGELVLAGLSRSVQEVFRIVGFDVIFRIYPDVDQAVRAFEE